MPLVRKAISLEPPQRPSPERPGDIPLHGSADERWAAARSLTGQAAEPALVRALSVETDPQIREAILTNLVSIGTVSARRAVCDQLRSENADARSAALDALKAARDATLPHVSELLVDADPDVRLLACEVVRGFSMPKAQSLLTALLERDDQINVCAAAIEVLSEIGTISALPSLDACRHRFAHDPFLRFSIDAAVRLIGGRPLPARE